MLRRLAAAAAASVLLGAAPTASADTTTTLRPPSRSPVTIAGTGLKRGEQLSGSQVLMRRLTSVSVGTRRVIELRCPDGRVHAGLGFLEETRLGFGALNRYPGKRVARVQVFSAARDAERGD